jgi:hypothetical protein
VKFTTALAKESDAGGMTRCKALAGHGLTERHRRRLVERAIPARCGTYCAWERRFHGPRRENLSPFRTSRPRKPRGRGADRRPATLGRVALRQNARCGQVREIIVLWLCCGAASLFSLVGKNRPQILISLLCAAATIGSEHRGWKIYARSHPLTVRKGVAKGPLPQF